MYFRLHWAVLIGESERVWGEGRAISPSPSALSEVWRGKLYHIIWHVMELRQLLSTCTDVNLHRVDIYWQDNSATAVCKFQWQTRPGSVSSGDLTALHPLKAQILTFPQSKKYSVYKHNFFLCPELLLLAEFRILISVRTEKWPARSVHREGKHERERELWAEERQH